MKKHNHWSADAIIYHIYPLGLCGAPAQNDFNSPPIERLRQLYGWTSHIQELGCNTIYMGPLFESSAHGYDTADYFTVDRRLGTNQTFRALSTHWHQMGFRLLLDGVFNHVGRDFQPFKDLQIHGKASAFKDWFSGIDFTKRSPFDDPFSYDSWKGNYDLVKLNLAHPEVRAYLFSAIETWMDEYAIDGLRIDVAEQIDLDFLKALSLFCRQKRADFWLMGEVVEGKDYRKWANPDLLDSVTNYQGYGAILDGHTQKTYVETAQCLNQQFGLRGQYTGLILYNFVDNHDVNRVAGMLQNPAHLILLYVFLFTLPGVPSVYYGSEWGLDDTRQGNGDQPLRPFIPAIPNEAEQARPDLLKAIRRLARLRREYAALRYGSYEQTLVDHHQIAYVRRWQQETMLVVINAHPTEVSLPVPLLQRDATLVRELWNENVFIEVHAEHLQVKVPAYTTCIFKLDNP